MGWGLRTKLVLNIQSVMWMPRGLLVVMSVSIPSIWVGGTSEGAIVRVTNHLCNGVFSRPLRSRSRSPNSDSCDKDEQPPPPKMIKLNVGTPVMPWPSLLTSFPDPPQRVWELGWIDVQEINVYKLDTIKQFNHLYFLTRRWRQPSGLPSIIESFSYPAT